MWQRCAYKKDADCNGGTTHPTILLNVVVVTRWFGSPRLQLLASRTDGTGSTTILLFLISLHEHQKCF